MNHYWLRSTTDTYGYRHTRASNGTQFCVTPSLLSASWWRLLISKCDDEGIQPVHLPLSIEHRLSSRFILLNSVDVVDSPYTTGDRQ